jgi:PadR family transcriptional regulator PadR
LPDLFRGLLPLLILRTVAEGELYGYEISRRIRQSTGEALALSEGSLYPALHRLEADGALEAKWQPSEKGPSRRYYRITKKGSGMLAKYEREWTDVRLAVDRLGPQAT